MTAVVTMGMGICCFCCRVACCCCCGMFTDSVTGSASPGICNTMLLPVVDDPGCMATLLVETCTMPLCSKFCKLTTFCGCAVCCC